jgi:hypothetical protein
MAPTLARLAPHRALVDSSPFQLSVELSWTIANEHTPLTMWR